MTQINSNADNNLSREEEAWCIEARAEELREKAPPQPNPWTPGFERRVKRSTVEVFQKLAVLQSRYYETFDLQKNDHLDQWHCHLEEMQRIGRHALLLLMPLLSAGQKRLCQHTGAPCPKLKDDPNPNGLTISRCDLRRGRFLTAWQIIMQHAIKEGPPRQHGYSWPIVSVRERARSEIWDARTEDQTNERRVTKHHVVGMAVIKEFRRHNGRGNSIDAAFVAVSKLGTIDGISTGGRESVRKHYLAFRKDCFERGYADERAFWASYNSEKWPSDQIWLADFPQNAEG